MVIKCLFLNLNFLKFSKPIWSNLSKFFYRLQHMIIQNSQNNFGILVPHRIILALSKQSNFHLRDLSKIFWGDHILLGLTYMQFYNLGNLAIKKLMIQQWYFHYVKKLYWIFHKPILTILRLQSNGNYFS